MPTGARAAVLTSARAALQAAQEAHSAEQQREKQHYEALLARARTSQVGGWVVL